MTVGCVGWSGALKWDTSFREIYVDRDLGRWSEPGLARQVDLASSSFTAVTGPQVDWDDNGPALRTGFNATKFDASHLPIGEAWYDAAGIPIGSLYYAWERKTGIDHTLGGWSWGAFLSLDDTASSIDSAGPLRAAGPSSGTLSATTSTRGYALVQLYYGVAGGTTDAPIDYNLAWTCLAVYGTHGLTKRGTATYTDAQGYYASDIIDNVVSRQCPFMVRNIDTTSFIIPQAAWLDPVDAATVVESVNAYHLHEYGTWCSSTGAPEFFYRAPTDELVWEARLDRGAKVSLEGDDATGWWNGVVVYYTDGYGRSRVAGPTGYTLADTTDDGLQDTSDANPVNAHGLGRKWATLSLSNPTTDAGAIQIGSAWLTETSLPQRRGSITLTGTVTHPQEGEVPVTRIRAGDHILISDKPGDVSRRIVSTSYTHPGQVTCDVGGMPARIEALLERLGVTFQGRL